MIPKATEAAAQHPGESGESDADLDAKAQAAANKLVHELAHLPLVVAAFDACAAVFALEPPYGSGLYFFGVSANGVPDEVLDSGCNTVLLASDVSLPDGPGTAADESSPSEAWNAAACVAARKLINAISRHPDAMKAFADASALFEAFSLRIDGGVPATVIAWGTEYDVEVPPVPAVLPQVPGSAPPTHAPLPIALPPSGISVTLPGSIQIVGLSLDDVLALVDRILSRAPLTASMTSGATL